MPASSAPCREPAVFTGIGFYSFDGDFLEIADRRFSQRERPFRIKIVVDELETVDELPETVLDLSLSMVAGTQLT